MAAITLSAHTVAENPDDNTEIGALSVDGQVGEVFTYTLASSFSARFEIIGSTLYVKKGAAGGVSLFNFEDEALNHFLLSISAKGDKGTEVAATEFRIDVTDKNENPTDISLSKLTVDEHSGKDAEVGQLSAIDPDAGDTHTFTLTDDVGGLFKLDVTGTKILVDGSKLEYGKSGPYNVKVLVEDADGLSLEKTFAITVADVVDTFNGGSKNDRLSGTVGNDVINGGAGNDKLYGLAGDDTIHGGLGKDMLYGGTGKDTFVFDTPVKPGHFDHVVDFNSADDTLLFDLTALKSFKIKYGKKFMSAEKVFKSGKLNKKFFTVGDKAKDSNDYVYYNKKNGAVYLDVDGAGHGHKGIQILKVKPGSTLTADDFLFVNFAAYDPFIV
ncbi:calcium-binding protein [Microvirga terricola]|uniref:Cadherin domain-containing protein n=1 Tax=Microvirga terricola TaxID=2719797 RepID=A0ABX0VCT7_9HYPH|nr:hypothetical protein [Microvirga terricola]NIX77663.1 hypothetical protein [Microvirga terricola]